MSRTSHIRLSCAVLIPVLFPGCYCSTANAQGLTPSKGEGTVSVTYQNYDVAGHFNPQGQKNNNGGTQSHVVVTEVDYGITNDIGITVGLPFVASKYTGP